MSQICIFFFLLKIHDCYENSVLLAIVTHHKQNTIFILKADLMSRTVLCAYL